MKQTTILPVYTELEKEFIIKACELLEISTAVVLSHEGNISHYSIIIANYDSTQERLLGSLMRYNYEKCF